MWKPHLCDTSGSRCFLNRLRTSSRQVKLGLYLTTKHGVKTYYIVILSEKGSFPLRASYDLAMRIRCSKAETSHRPLQIVFDEPPLSWSISRDTELGPLAQLASPTIVWP